MLSLVSDILFAHVDEAGTGHGIYIGCGQTREVNVVSAVDWSEVGHCSHPVSP